jgi:hypothetical protein
MSGRPGAGGIYFGPTCNGKQYLSLYDHRGSRPGAAVWHPSISPQDEFDLFNQSDGQDQQDGKGHYWSFAHPNGDLPVGSNRERIAKHPSVTNANDPWHGYPSSPKRRGDADAPDDDLIDQLEAAGKITRAFAQRIRTRRI